ncbi:MAG: hypothetical protein SH847_11795 [Roseiflexaceae bacterium]|nr:hypothetical protein [Roseiflexaceae bacterium]
MTPPILNGFGEMCCPDLIPPSQLGNHRANLPDQRDLNARQVKLADSCGHEPISGGIVLG